MTAEELMQEIRGHLALNEKERAVVDTAEALLVDDLPLQLRVDRITDAVRAMQAEEKP